LDSTGCGSPRMPLASGSGPGEISTTVFPRRTPCTWGILMAMASWNSSPENASTPTPVSRGRPKNLAFIATASTASLRNGKKPSLTRGSPRPKPRWIPRSAMPWSTSRGARPEPVCSWRFTMWTGTSTSWPRESRDCTGSRTCGSPRCPLPDDVRPSGWLTQASPGEDSAQTSSVPARTPER
jgi:hypothetical protein